MELLSIGSPIEDREIGRLSIEDDKNWLITDPIVDHLLFVER
jgi:hypothetical protein